MWEATTYSVKAPKAGGGKYRRPVDVVIVKGGRASCRNYCDDYKTIARNVDSRYDGPRAAYGQAMREAVKKAAKMNNKELCEYCGI